MLSAQKVLNWRGSDRQPGEFNAFQDTQGLWETRRGRRYSHPRWYRPHHQPMSGALRRNMHLDRTTVFGLWDAMSPRKNFSNKIVEAEANPASSSRVKAPPLDGMEWTTMNEDDADESLLVLIGELLYKNQLLREAIASKDEVIEVIINHLMIAATSACSCGVANQLTFVWNTVKERDVEVSAPQKVLLQRILQYCEAPDRQCGKFPLGRGDQSCRKL